jgi:hypothetical protein
MITRYAQFKRYAAKFFKTKTPFDKPEKNCLAFNLIKIKEFLLNCEKNVL